ncbi:hypothetical protein CEV08_09085 [Bartonella tribocorum]|uniref:Uncharacterized protein n=1 Tax=Bartonella tribocorum TaxID=85701 RepID=A0A2N9Y849_9HYPH|nr:hypothetical protein CEV08_09085 [Bartonella tribocorum]
MYAGFLFAEGDMIAETERDMTTENMHKYKGASVTKTVVLKMVALKMITMGVGIKLYPKRFK